MAWTAGQAGVSWEEFQELNNPGKVNDPCGCFAKSFLGIEEAAFAAGTAGADYATGAHDVKPRGGAAGGGRAGKSTSRFSHWVHKRTVARGVRNKTAAARAARRMGRKVMTRFIPGVGIVLFVYDISVYVKCREECDQCEQQ